MITMHIYLQRDADALLLGCPAEDKAERQRRVARHLDVGVVVRHQRRQQLPHLQAHCNGQFSGFAPSLM